MVNKRHIYIPRPHVLYNVNEIHAAEKAVGTFNQKIAVALTKAVGTMTCAYAFVCLAVLGFPALSVLFGPTVAIYVVWFSQTFLQLVFLPVLSVGQAVLGRKQELQADESFHIAQNNEHDLEQIVSYLAAIDEHGVAQILARLTALEADIAMMSAFFKGREQ
jgi:hypothetical protein